MPSGTPLKLEQPTTGDASRVVGKPVTNVRPDGQMSLPTAEALVPVVPRVCIGRRDNTTKPKVFENTSQASREAGKAQ